MTTSPGFFYSGGATSCQAFEQLDIDEIPEFRPREGSLNTSVGNESGYSSSFQEVPRPSPAQYLPQFYLYSSSGHTLIPCEEIIISNTIYGPGGHLYQSPTKAYVAYPVQEYYWIFPFSHFCLSFYQQYLVNEYPFLCAGP